VRAFYLGLSSHGNTYKIIKNLPQSWLFSTQSVLLLIQWLI
jgi:hypothetical protein